MHIPSSRRGHLPPTPTPAPFATPDGRFAGWKVTFPGDRPVATPAVAGGRVFVGAGFGSYEFYALDAATGAVAWAYQTTDDGPTAAAVLGDHVAFATESCELEVLTTGGRGVWKRWLGDPLLSMPAVAPGRVFAAFPDSRGDRRHYLGCFDLGTGADVWRVPTPGELISAPVLAAGHVYAATVGGVVVCCRQADGGGGWQEERKATSAPAVWQGQCFYSQREPQAGPRGGAAYQTEHVTTQGAFAGSPSRAYRATSKPAGWLDAAKRAAGSPKFRSEGGYDAGVGFAAHKGDGKLDQARLNLGTPHVSAVWGYQGSKPFVAGGRVFSSVGDAVHCVDPGSGDEWWNRRLHEAAGELLDAALTPPAVANGKLFVGTAAGEVVCLAAASGELLWRAEVGEPVLFPPAVSGGRVYVGTGCGSVVSFATGDPADDGWPMWGGGPAHNGPAA